MCWIYVVAISCSLVIREPISRVLAGVLPWTHDSYHEFDFQRSTNDNANELAKEWHQPSMTDIEER